MPGAVLVEHALGLDVQHRAGAGVYGVLVFRGAVYEADLVVDEPIVAFKVALQALHVGGCEPASARAADEAASLPM